MSGTMRPKQMAGPGAWDKHQQWRWAFAPIRTLIALYLPCLLFFAGAAIAAGPPIETIDALWAGFDPRATPLDVEVVKVWDEGDVHLEMIYFTGEMFEGEKTRVFGYLGRPKSVSGKLPGILHIHGGGQTANLEWPRFWARRGFVCLTFDFCGDTSLPTLGPEYRRERFTQWGRVQADMMKVGGGTRMSPTPRHNPWYHWALTARRGLTLLETQPQVDGEKLGIFGISVGGTLTWTVAGVDRRVKAAVPIYGCGWEFYPYPPKVDDHQAEELRLWRQLIAPEAHAGRITCPILFLSATNDSHGKMDLSFRTLDLAPSPMRRQLFSANYDHHVEPAEASSLPLWMETHLLGKRPAWPAAPAVEVVGPGIPQVRVIPADPDSVTQVDLYYCLNNDWPMSRFWRLVPSMRRQGIAFVAEAPCLAADDVLYLFANVTDKAGVRQSSRLVTQPLKNLTGIRPTLWREPLIDAMETNTAWNWVPAYTDPSRADPFFQPWSGPDKERGFTLDQRTFPYDKPMVFYFGTRKIGDPQYRGSGDMALLIDLFAPQLPSQLTVRLRHRKPGGTESEYSVQPGLPPVGTPGTPAWQTLRLERRQFRSALGEILPTWDHVEYFILHGTSPVKKPPIFRQLRWES